MMRPAVVRHIWLAGVFVVALAGSACRKGDVRFGTAEYWDLPAEQRDGPRTAFMARQEERARLLVDRSNRIGTFEGELLGRQYSLWSEWTRRMEDDPVATEEVLAKWLKELNRARRERRHAPRNVLQLRAWLLDRQDQDIGSWAPSDAPLWLAVGETARALSILARNGEVPELKQRLVFLHILQDPKTSWESIERLLETGEEKPFPEAVRSSAWLPWLQWTTRDLVHWPPHWRNTFRTYCTEEWLDRVSGGYPAKAGHAMDLVTTYRLSSGWNPDADIPAWIPAPQQMVNTLFSRADTLSYSTRPMAASLLVGSLADLDTQRRGETCRLLSIWHDEAIRRLGEGFGELTELSWSLRLLCETGPCDGPVLRWMAQFGCDVGAIIRYGDPMVKATVDQLHRIDDHDPVRLRMLVDCGRFAPMM